MIGSKSILISSSLATASGGAAVVDEATLVPIGLMIAGVLGTATITWKVAVRVLRMQQDLKDARKQLADLERLYGRRRSSTQDARGAGDE